MSRASLVEIVKEWELFDSIELLERLLSKPSCNIVESTIDSSLSLFHYIQRDVLER